MVTEFNNLWYEAKPKIRERLENTDLEKMNNYAQLCIIMLEEFNQIIKKDSTKDESDLFKLDVKTIDYGDYQGTLILTFAKDVYQPEIYETYYTYVRYGSCPGCDTLQSIIYANPYCYDEYDSLTDKEKIKYMEVNKQQIDDLLTLCLHMVEKISQFDSEVCYE